MNLGKTVIAYSGILLTLLLATQAWSHAIARESIPENGAVLSESPTELVLQFGGPAKLVSLTISADENEPVNVDISNATSVDGRVSVDIEPLAPGNYKIIWRAMGLDGHVTSGTFSFAVSAPA